MLTLFRRHRKSCPQRKQGRHYRRCQCPIWVDGRLGAEEIRKSLGMRDWQKAQGLVRQWEAEGQRSSERQIPTIAEAVERFLADAEARKLRQSTINKYKALFEQMKDFCARRGLTVLAQVDVDTLSAFRAEWKDGARTALKKLERLRAFFHFAERRKWVESNPARDLKAPKVTPRPTMSYTRDEMISILAAADEVLSGKQAHGKDNARRLRALILLLRYSGLRISDAVRCSVEQIVDGKLRLYTQKSGTPVYCPLPDFLLKELDSIPRMSARFWFWTGNGRLQTAVTDWQARLLEVFQKAKISGGHAHRFRDTFAVELLLAGVPLERVSVLLGHASIRVTEKHYAPWVKARQDQAEADVRCTWAQDPVVLLATKGTPEVHAGARKPN